MISISCNKTNNPFQQTLFKEVPATLETLEDVITQDVWSPIVWYGGRRKKSNFKLCRFAALDIDEGVSIADARMWLDRTGLAAIVATTRHHQKEKKTSREVKPACDRFRVVIPFSSSCTDIQNYEYTMRQLNVELSCDNLFDGARFFYPSVEVVYATDGLKLAWSVKPPPTKADILIAKQRAFESQNYRDNHALPPWMAKVIRDGPEANYGRHKMCYRLGAEMTKLGWSSADIVGAIMSGPIGAIGLKDVERAVQNGSGKTR